MSTEDPITIDPTGSDIHGEGARLRAEGPIAPIELPGGVRAWSVVGLDAVEKVLTDPRFSKDAGAWTAYQQGEIGDDFPLIGWILMDNLTTAYGQDHTRLRKLVAHAFTPRKVEAMQETIEKVVAEHLDRLQHEPPDAVVDLKSRYAQPVPAQVICDLFGVPEDSREVMLRGGAENVDTTRDPGESATNVERWNREIEDFVATKRAQPSDDLTSELIAARDGSSRLSDSELVGTLHLLLAVGTEPVMNTVANAVVALLSHPDQLALVLDGRASWREAIEEVLRNEAPVAHLPFRFTTEEVTVEGVTVPKGEPVLVHFAAAGRDPDKHRAPERFDLQREDKTHVSFGRGIYRCIGSTLAMLEAEATLSALFERFPDLRLATPAQDISAQPTFIMNGRAEVPVVLGRPAG